MNKMQCKGQIFRGRASVFLNTKGIYIYQERMIPMKRLSCTGCDSCGSLIGLLSEGYLEMDTRPIIQDIEDGALYQLRIVNESKDWETGHVDDFDLEFVKTKEIQND